MALMLLKDRIFALCNRCAAQLFTCTQHFLEFKPTLQREMCFSILLEFPPLLEMIIFRHYNQLCFHLFCEMKLHIEHFLHLHHEFLLQQHIHMNLTSLLYNAQLSELVLKGSGYQFPFLPWWNGNCQKCISTLLMQRLGTVSQILPTSHLHL